MRYRYFDSIRICRQAVKQAKSFAILTDESPSGPNNQVLLMAGRQGRERVPLCYPDPDTVRNIIGSVLVRTRDSELVGVIGWASDPAAQLVRERYLAGELSVSLITKPISGVQLERGEQFHHVVGPAIVTTQWEPIQVVLS